MSVAVHGIIEIVFWKLGELTEEVIVGSSSEVVIEFSIYSKASVHLRSLREI